ncbi:hypothetical protein SAMN05216389_10980 [Oceanobacillus limi]|uniref:Uncharacterized protein n=1 Tax=Oceanobacillus limi TaxID=930131 RepID=A0A1I0DPW4_9BACI|nr:hypothetical protein [Oceanobacillus limi]SET34414.1 hypothetical protein SAMN05216389_10980 [Oceanobacillus limi]
MKKIEINEKQLIKLAKKHKKFLESYSINRVAYLFNDHVFYLAYFSDKSGQDIKGDAVISPDSDDISEYQSAHAPLLEHAATVHNIKYHGGDRAKVNYAIFYEVRDYLENVVQANILSQDLQVVYERAFKVISNMITLQDELVRLYYEAMDLHNETLKRGYFVDEELEKLKSYIPILEQIQYEQGKDRYNYRADFDVIYENRNDPNVKQFEKFTDKNTLRELTTEASEKDIKKGLQALMEGIDLDESNYTKEKHYEAVRAKFANNLEKLIHDSKSKLRYP